MALLLFNLDFVFDEAKSHFLIAPTHCALLGSRRWHIVQALTMTATRRLRLSHSAPKAH